MRRPVSASEERLGNSLMSWKSPLFIILNRPSDFNEHWRRPKAFCTKASLEDACPIQSAAHSRCHYSSCADVALSLSSSSCFCAEKLFLSSLWQTWVEQQIFFLPPRGWKLIFLVCSVVASYIHFVYDPLSMCVHFLCPLNVIIYAIICVFARDSAVFLWRTKWIKLCYALLAHHRHQEEGLREHSRIPFDVAWKRKSESLQLIVHRSQCGCQPTIQPALPCDSRNSNESMTPLDVN